MAASVARAGVIRRLYRIHPLSALLLCLPGVVLCLWYGWSAYASLDRYRRATEPQRELTAELFQLFLHDQLRRDIRRMRLPSPPRRSKVPHFAFHLDAESLDTLLEGVHLKQKRPYVPARLQFKGRSLPVKLHVRGQRHWHLLGQQKSLKVRLPKGDLLMGHRVFNLINDPMAEVVGETLIMDLAREAGLLTPRSSFARVSINGADLGLYRYDTHVDESLLRMHRRIPGSIYSGNLPPRAKPDRLWRADKGWKKVASRGAEQQRERTDIKQMVWQLSSASVQQFADFAHRALNLKAFATLDALDVAFGIPQRDYVSNHKLYFDPYRGRWEPVVWNVRGFGHEPYFNLVENPLLLRLKYLPDYRSLRNRILYDLLSGSCSPAAVRARAAGLLKELGPELASDPYWDAYKLLPRADDFFRRMIRPMDFRRMALVLESTLATYQDRHAFLMRQLQSNPLRLKLGNLHPAGGIPLWLVVEGRVGARLTGFEAQWPSTCKERRWQVFRGIQPITPVSISSSAELLEPIEVHPGVRTVARPDANPRWGAVRTEVAPLTYHLRLETTCRPERLQAIGIHLATRSQIRSRSYNRDDIPAVSTLSATQVPMFKPGESGPHPWDLQQHIKETIHLGPGPVEVSGVRVFDSHQHVIVAPGTRLGMGPEASLVFLGRVDFDGTRENPIVIEGIEGGTWGGMTLQGPETAGSTLRHLRTSGGSVPRWGLIPFPGTINIHDTKNITIEHCRFGDNQNQGDLVHAAYVQGLELDDVVVERAAVDALDLEFVTASLRRLHVRRPGDDALDLMGAMVKLSDSVLMGHGGNGVSAGEETEARLRSVLVAGGSVGVLAKNASSVDLASSLLYRNATGVRIYKRTVRYSGDSQVRADVLFIVGSETEIKTDKTSRSALKVRRIQRRLPRAGVLDHLLKDVLSLDRWDRLEEWIGGGR